MVYISLWQDFQEAAEELYSKEPVKTRYSVKWKANIGTLILKITDDTTCVKYKTRSSIILNRFEALNLSLMRKMQNRKAPVAIIIPEIAPGSGPNASAQPVDGLPGTTVASVAAAAGVAASSGVKKKKGKKKK